VGKDFEGATITVPAGADQVPGLTEALPEGRTEAPVAEQTPTGDQPAAEAKPSVDQVLEKSS